MPLLPVRHEGQLRIVRWGCRRGESRVLPVGGWTRLATVESGYWSAVRRRTGGRAGGAGPGRRGVVSPSGRGCAACWCGTSAGPSGCTSSASRASHYYARDDPLGLDARADRRAHLIAVSSPLGAALPQSGRARRRRWRRLPNRSPSRMPLRCQYPVLPGPCRRETLDELLGLQGPRGRPAEWPGGRSC